MRGTGDTFWFLAIETSGPTGAVALGRAADARVASFEIVGEAEMPPPVRGGHKRVDLVPAIARLCEEQAVAPAEIGEVYVSIGPGSFTGLRNAVTTAKMLALVNGTKIVAVPTAVAIALGVDAAVDSLAVCLNTKRDQMFTTFFDRTDDGANPWQVRGEPALLTPDEICSADHAPAAIYCDHPPSDGWPDDAIILEKQSAKAMARSVAHLGRQAAAADQFTDPLKLLPLYAREPEAVSLWKARETKD